MRRLCAAQESPCDRRSDRGDGESEKAAAGFGGGNAAPTARRPADRRAARRDQGLPGRPHGARPGLAGDQPRRVRLPGRPDRLRQVDPDQAADPRAGRDRGQRQDRRPRHRRAAGEEDPAAAAQHRHRLPGLQAAARPHRLRQRRLRAAGDRRQPRRDPRPGAGDAAPRRPLDQAPQLPRPALRRRAAARLDRPRLRQPPAPAARRRAERQPRPGHLDRRHAASLPDQQDRHDRPRRHPRSRDGRQHAAPRDRALRGPRRPRRGQRRLHRGVDHRVRPADAGRDGRRPRGPDQRPRHASPCSDVQARLLHPGGIPGAAPQRGAEHGGDRHHGRHRDPARRPHPGLPDDAGEERTGARTASSSGSRSTTTRPSPKSPHCRRKLEAIPHVASVHFITKAGGAQGTEGAARQDEERRTCWPSFTRTRCRPTSQSRPTTPPTSPRSARR